MTTKQESNQKISELIRSLRGVTVVVPTSPAHQAMSDLIRAWAHHGEVVKPLDETQATQPTKEDLTADQVMAALKLMTAENIKFTEAKNRILDAQDGNENNEEGET